MCHEPWDYEYDENESYIEEEDFINTSNTNMSYINLDLDYDEFDKSYTMKDCGESEICMFLRYVEVDRFDSCRIYVVSSGKILIVPQHQLKLLSKNG